MIDNKIKHCYTLTDRQTDRQTDRLAFIDGMRGIASLLVVFCHLACVFMPGLYFSKYASSEFEKLWLGTPLNVLTNGDTAVQLFFVLSGFLIARKVYNRGVSALNLPIKVYLKLLHIVVPAILLSAVLMRSGQMYHIRALQNNEMLSFVKDYNVFSVSILGLLEDIFVKTFISGSSYVGPFWTIHYELFGSVLVGLVTWYVSNLEKGHKAFYLCIAMSFLLLMDATYISFILGAFVYECIYRMRIDKSLLGTIVDMVSHSRILLGLMWGIGIYFGTCSITFEGLYGPLCTLRLGGVIRAIGVAVILFCILNCKSLQSTLSIRWLVYLGSVSQFVYAFHWPVILSLGCGLYIVLCSISYNIAVLVISILVITFVYFLANIYTNILPKILLREKQIIAFMRKTIILRLQKKE